MDDIIDEDLTGLCPDAQAALPHGEKLVISSGQLVVIDQFMLANKQFLAPLEKLRAQGSFPEKALPELSELVKKFGGVLIELAPNTYDLLRNPHEAFMIVVAEKLTEPKKLALLDKVLSLRETPAEVPPALGAVFVDTRCLVFIDATLLGDHKLLNDFLNLRRCGEDKQGRDLLRSRGASVRYGFNRRGDELGVFKVENDVLFLWPDMVDS